MIYQNGIMGLSIMAGKSVFWYSPYWSKHKLMIINIQLCTSYGIPKSH